MPRIQARYIAFGCCLSLIVALGLGSGCKKKEQATAASTDSNPTVGDPEPTKMYVRVYDEGKFNFFFQNGLTPATFGTECAIPIGATYTTDRDIQCIAHVNEGDLFYYGIKLQINVPAGMCNYFAAYPYFYYSRQPGYIGDGFNPVSVTIDKAAGTCSPAANFTYSEGNCMGTGTTEWNAYGDGQAEARFYDYTDNNGPNCAKGKWSITVVDATDTGGATTKTTTTGDFGGQIENCLAGPPYDNEWPKDGSNRPIVKMTDVTSQGVNELYELKPIMNTASGGSMVPIANFFNYDYQVNGGAKKYSTDIPFAIAPAQDADGTAIPDAHAPYEYLCLDQAFEVKHRIRVWINEWNTRAEFDKYGVQSTRATATPDTTGAETSPGAGVPDFGEKNDRYDWDNFATTTFPET